MSLQATLELNPEEMSFLTNAIQLLTKKLFLPTAFFEQPRYYAAYRRVAASLKGFPIAKLLTADSAAKKGSVALKTVRGLGNMFLVELQHIRRNIDCSMPLGERSPMMIVGFSGAGMTLLHTLMSLDPASRGIRKWEEDIQESMFYLNMRSEQQAACQQRLMDEGKDPNGANQSCECNVITSWALGVQTFSECLHHLSGKELAQWSIDRKPLLSQMTFLKHFLQVLMTDSNNNSSTTSTFKQWILMDSGFLPFMDLVAAALHGTSYIWVHQNVKDAFLARAEEYCACNITNNNPIQRDFVRAIESFLQAGLKARTCLSSSSRIVDVYYEDIISDPIGTIQHVYTVLGRGPVSLEFTMAIEQWLVEHPAMGIKKTYRAGLKKLGVASEDHLNRLLRDYVNRFPRTKA